MSLSASVGVQIPTNVVEVGNEISLSAINALAAASSPATVNPFMTSSAVSGTYLTTATASSTYLTTSAASSTYQPIGSYLTDAPNNGNEYVRKNAAWAVATGGGGATAASQLTNAAYTTNPAASPTTAGDVLQFNGTALVWAAGGGGGGGVAWGGITGTVTAQTALTSYVTGLGYQTAGDVTTYVTGLGYITSVPSKTVQTIASSGYIVQAGDQNKIIHFTTGGISISLPADSTYAFPNGTEITICQDSGLSGNQISGQFAGQPTINGASSASVSSTVSKLVKTGTDVWLYT